MIDAQARLNGLRNITWIHAALVGSDGEADASTAG